jgi:S-formylglutathione hydrolase FrmB
MFGRGQNYSAKATGDSLGLNAKGQLIFGNGQETLTGKASAERWKWHHALLVREGENVQVYLDGKLEISGEASAVNNVETLFLGGRNDNQSNWEGRLDEAAIFNRPLSANEVKALSTP